MFQILYIYALCSGVILTAGAQTISSLAPNPVIQGASVSIYGSGFGSESGGSNILLNGSIYPFNTWSNTVITAFVPTNAIPGSYKVQISVNGNVSNSESLMVIAGPTISSITPSPAAPGATVTIAGAGFGSPGGSSELTFNGSSYPYLSWSNTAITAVIPAGTAPTSGVVGVTVDGVASNTVSESIVPVATVTSVTPNPASVGTTVTVAGTNMGSAQGQSTVTYDGIAFPASTWSPTAVTAMVPVGSASGTGTVGVTVGGVASNTENLTVNNNPNISLAPATGPVQMGFVIQEYNFPTGGTPVVTFNGNPAEIVSSTSSSVTIQVPANAPYGNATVVLTAGSTTGHATFAVISALGCPGS